MKANYLIIDHGKGEARYGEPGRATTVRPVDYARTRGVDVEIRVTKRYTVIRSRKAFEISENEEKRGSVMINTYG